MTNKKKLKSKVMASKTRINRMDLKSILRFPNHPGSLRILHLTLVSKELDHQDFQEVHRKLGVIPKLVISMLALMISMMLETLKKLRKTLKLNRVQTQMQIQDLLKEAIKATISEVSVHLLKPVAQEEMKKKSQIETFSKVVPQ